MVNYKTYLRSPEWQVKRQEKLESCQGKCECEEWAEEGGCHRPATQIHHLHYDTLGNENLDDLQALCPSCHMKKSNVRDFYGDVPSVCCQAVPDDEVEKPKKVLPYSVYHEAKWHYHDKPEQYDRIASKLETEPILVALLDNLGILFACGDIGVTPKITKAIERFVDIVDGEWLGLGEIMTYKLKPKFEKYFPQSDSE